MYDKKDDININNAMTAYVLRHTAYLYWYQLKDPPAVFMIHNYDLSFMKLKLKQYYKTIIHIILAYRLHTCSI